jgi:tRNA-splicing ligase RtcB
MEVIHETGKRPIHLWATDVEEKALEQLKNLASLPFIHPHGIAGMPDVHFGIGATVGSVIATRGAIIPAAVGVDIGCGMIAAKTNLNLSQFPDSLLLLRHSIERGVPLGAGGRHKEAKGDIPSFTPQMQRILEEDLKVNIEKLPLQLCTLGSGNHFIEVCGDENQEVWIMLHSGSRGIGNQIGRHFIEIAKKEMERYFITLPDQDLAYLVDGSVHHEDYCEAVEWAQDFAMLNRKYMLDEVFRDLKAFLPKLDVQLTTTAVNCHHNYVTKEHHYGKDVWLTRKGAIRARTGDLGIVPGSMGQRSYIVRGLGNPASYNSCSHGAGRKYGRRAARERFTVEDLKQATEGVECRKDDSVLDELPQAYKNIDEVMANQKDLVEVVHTLKQVLCVKGG